MENTEVVTQDNKPKKTPKETTFFVIRIVLNVIFYCLIVLLLLFSIMNINGGKKNSDKFPNIFGRGYLNVLTDSMDGKCDETYKDENFKVKSFKSGDLVFVKVFDSNSTKSLKVGDVVTFFDSTLNGGKGALNTHRIVRILDDGITVVTQGDKKAEYQSYYKAYQEDNSIYMMQLEDSKVVEIVSASSIRGVVTSVKAGGGKTIENIQNNWLWYFVLPVALFLIFELFMVVKNIMDLKGAKQKAELANNKEAMSKELEAQKEEMRKQILAELAAQQQASAQNTNTSEETTDDNLDKSKVEDEFAQCYQPLDDNKENKDNQ